MTLVLQSAKRCLLLITAFVALTANECHLAIGNELASVVDTQVFRIPSVAETRVGESSADSVAISYEVAACQTCGQASGNCGCGGAIGVSGTPRTNLFWCSPGGELLLDPCNDFPCAACGVSDMPLFYAVGELLPLTRDQKNERAFQTLGPGGPVVLETGDFETEFDAGARATLGVALTDLTRLEGTYVGSYEWNTVAAVRNQSPNSQGTFGNLFSPFSQFGVPVGFIGTDFNEFASIEFQSNFQSAELNLRHRVLVPQPCWPPGGSSLRHCTATSFLLGVRYMTVEEQFGYLTSSTVPAGGSVNRANVATENSMVGVQIGMLSQFLARRSSGWIDFEIKGGIYHNEASLASSYQNTDLAGTTFASFTGTDERDRTAFMGELSLVYNQPVTRHLTFRAGYNAFWLTGLALATENFTNNLNLISAGPAQVNHDGDVVYHGPNVGLVWAY